METNEYQNKISELESQLKELSRTVEVYRLAAEKRKYEMQIHQENYDRLLEKIIERIK